MNLAKRWDNVMMATYPVPSMSAVRGQGAVVWDEDGKQYTDMLAGLAVNILGHAHPHVVAAVSAQMSTLGHVSNMVASEPAVALAEKLLAMAGRDGRVFFCNSGTEANEAALKISRLMGRHHVVAAHAGFHGRTMGSLTLTGQPQKQTPFMPLLPDVTHIPYGDVDALSAAVTSQTAMIILEPILGEGGVVPAPPGYLAAAREITSQHGALFVIDEVQTGMGRTGEWFAHQHAGVLPDIVTTAKGLAGGLPIGACLAFGETADLFTPGQHGSTFGGNPITCAAALAVIDVIEREGLVERAAVLGAFLRNGIEELHHPAVAQVRGQGMLLGIVLHDNKAHDVEVALREAGFLTKAANETVVRIAPPLILEDTQAASFLSALPAALSVAV